MIGLKLNSKIKLITDKSNFEENLKIIDNQIKQIGNLVNEFSDFARMPKPVLKENNLVQDLEDNINFLSKMMSL